MAVYQKIYTPREVVKSLPALDLPPTPSPKLKAVKKPRVHIPGCPPVMHFRKTLPIGMLYAALTAEKRPHTSI